MTPILETKGFATAVIDALVSQFCVVDRDGFIIVVNRAWLNFRSENSPAHLHSDVGSNYLWICQTASGPGSEEGKAFALGLASVLSGTTDLFEMEYPCHSPIENRWLLGRAAPLRIEQGGAIISHHDLTHRKLVEFELARLAATDPLTGLPNRRFFEQTSDVVLGRVNRFSGSASVILFDVDNFKALNDTYGHALGDEALRCLAHACKSSLRQMDIFARHGGEEFVILLPGADEEAAFNIAEKLRVATAQMALKEGRRNIKVTASFGVAELRPSDQSIDAAVARADIALYAAKRSGRNCVKSFAMIEHEADRRMA